MLYDTVRPFNDAQVVQALLAEAAADQPAVRGAICEGS